MALYLLPSLSLQYAILKVQAEPTSVAESDIALRMPTAFVASNIALKILGEDFWQVVVWVDKYIVKKYEGWMSSTSKSEEAISSGWACSHRKPPPSCHSAAPTEWRQEEPISDGSRRAWIETRATQNQQGEGSGGNKSNTWGKCWTRLTPNRRPGLNEEQITVLQRN